MREIEYRGLAEIEGKKEWIKGYYVDGCIVGGVVEANEEYIALERWWPVDKGTVGQYTGVKDENGKKVYKGDIVKQHYFYEECSLSGVREKEAEIIGEVGIDEFGVCTFTKEGHVHYWLELLAEPEEQLEVIGNIYENRELLEV